jgi:hypothetical protein
MKNKLIILLISLSILAGFVLFFQSTVDDAFICFRYGYNLINHGIWNWNPDNERIEAYTSFTYMLLSIIPPILKIQPQIIFKMVSFIFFALIIRRLYISSENKIANLFVILLFSCNWQTHVHIYSGLETIFWFWLLIELFFLLYEDKIQEKQQIKLWCIALLLPLTRPEGAVFSLFLFVYIVFIKKQKLHLPSFLFFAGIGILYFIWRYHYFGMLLPTPFYNKTFSNTWKLFMFVINTLFSGLYLAFIFYLLRIVFRKSKQKMSVYFISLSLFVFFFSYAISFLFMNYADRFPYQILFPAIIFTTYVILNNEHEYYNKTIKVIIIFLFIKNIAGVLGLSIPGGGIIINGAQRVAADQRSYINIGKKLNKLKSKNVKVMLCDAGKMPYLSELKCYDYIGLADTFLCKHTMTKDYFNKINADLVIVGNIGESYKAPEKIPKNKNWLLDRIFPNTVPMFKHIIDTHLIMLETNRYKRIDGCVVSVDGFAYFYFFINKESEYYDDILLQVKSAIKESAEFKFSTKDFLSFKYLLY